jgi:hypothetical protein
MQNPSRLRQLKAKDVPDLRTQILNEQNGRCAICGIQITNDTGISLDHQHKTSREVIGEDGAGLIRGVLCRSCNVWEGKIWNNTNRYIQPNNTQDRINMLNKLIQYYAKDNYPLVHPSEEPDEPKLMKSSYNKLKKLYESSESKAKFPEYPKSKKMTKSLQKFYDLYELQPEFYNT